MSQNGAGDLAIGDEHLLEERRTAVTTALRQARGAEPLRAQVFKVPHHGSKHALNLELVEEIAPKVSIVSSVHAGGRYHFPHAVTQAGGGHRATAFALGVMLYLARADKTADLSSVASVSGGSLANGALAHRLDLSSCSRIQLVSQDVFPQ